MDGGLYEGLVRHGTLLLQVGRRFEWARGKIAAAGGRNAAFMVWGEEMLALPHSYVEVEAKLRADMLASAVRKKKVETGNQIHWYFNLAASGKEAG